QDSYTYLIVPDLVEIGFYLYVYMDRRVIADYLQDSFQAAIEFAAEEFGVHVSSWIRHDGEPPSL
ncbi:hypothetical protein, partial [Leptospira sp. id769339]|uniref:hypothetical protein n=1 Tax=Leptospira sp. id769339 TaxID=2864221 RepID=UPI00214B697B